MSKTVKVIIALALVLVLGIGIYFLITSQIKNDMQVSASEFTQLVKDPRATDGGDAGEIPDDEQIVKVHVNGYVVYGYTSTDERASYKYWTVFSSLYTADGQSILDDWVENYGLQEYSYSNPNAGSNWSTIIYLAVLVIGVVAIFIVERMTMKIATTPMTSPAR